MGLGIVSAVRVILEVIKLLRSPLLELILYIYR